MSQKIRVGHSPDADDAFMFWALAEGKIPLEGFEIEHVVEDIESLNQRAFHGELDVTALSCHAFLLVSDCYELIPYGASVGNGYGPVVIARPPEVAEAILGPEVASSSRPEGGSPRNDVRNRIKKARIAVPGRTTTAYLVLQIYEADFEPVFVPFDQIFQALHEGRADFGLLIHEGQLTYAEEGFEKVLDLGAWWKEQFDLPLPLGINAIRRELDPEIKGRFTDLFKKSIDFAMSHREEALGYALQFGRGMDAGRGDRFVGLYVNDDSLGLKEGVSRSLELLFDLGRQKGLLLQPLGRGTQGGISSTPFVKTPQRK